MRRRSVHENSSATVYETQLEYHEHDDSQRRQQDRDSVEQPSSVQDPTCPTEVRTHDITRVHDVTDKTSLSNVKDGMGEINKHVSDGVEQVRPDIAGRVVHK